MGRVLVLAAVFLGGVIFARAALDTALAVPRIAAEARETRAW